MSYRARVMVLGALVALPLLLLAVAGAIRDQAEQESALSHERAVVGRAVAAAADVFLQGDIAAVRAIAALPAVREFETRDGDEIERAMGPLFEAFPDVETLGVIGSDGWNVRSLTRHVPVPPRSVNVSDRPYFREALASGRAVVSSAVLSRVRPGVPVVAIAVAIPPPDGATGRAPSGVLIGTLSLGRLREAMQSMLPDRRLGIVLLDAEGQALVAPEVDPAAIRALVSLRGRADVDAVLVGETGSRRVQGPGGEELLVSFTPVPDLGWGVLVQHPAAAALASARVEAARSVGLLFLALALSCVMAWFLATRLARSFRQLDLARGQAELGRQRSALLAEWSRQLATTLDFEATLQAVARLAVPGLADWCLVDVVDPNSAAARRLAVAHADPSKAALADALRQAAPTDLQADTSVGRVVRGGQPLLLQDAAEGVLVSAGDGARSSLLRELAPRSAMVVPLCGRGGVLGAMTFLTDGSGRRYGPDDVALAEELAGRAALAVENAHLFAEVQEAVRTRDEFLAAASHDLKNPLSLMSLQAQLLVRRATRADTLAAGEVAELAERIEAIARRAADLVDELLDVARLEPGRSLDLERQPVDLAALVREALADLGSTAQGYELRLEGADEPLVGEWDARRLRRVVDNLLGNAIKYSPEGSEVVVSLSREVHGQSSRAVLAVRDQGIGIPKEDLPRLFERFQRGTNVVGRIAGTGIGLASARSIVESHGGTIALESEEGRGTVVVVRLPLDGVAAAEVA